MEQLVARRAHNPKVAGSSPAPATKNRNLIKSIRFFLFISNQFGRGSHRAIPDSNRGAPIIRSKKDILKRCHFDRGEISLKSQRAVNQKSKIQPYVEMT